MRLASVGLNRKKPASNSAASCRKPPLLPYVLPGLGSGSYRLPTSQPRSFGNEVMASTPLSTTCHRSSGLLTPPGKRQPIPTTAIGSVAAALSWVFWARSRSVSLSERRRALMSFSSGLLTSVALLRFGGVGPEAAQRHADEVVGIHGVDQVLLLIGRRGLGSGVAAQL